MIVPIDKKTGNPKEPLPGIVFVPNFICKGCGLIQYVGVEKDEQFVINILHLKGCKYASKD